MKSVSQRFKDYVLDGKPVSVEATIVLVDETEISINSSDVLQNGFKLESASSDMSVFQIGAVVISQLTLVLKNFDGRYNDVTFDGAVIKNIRECVTYDDGTVEKIKHQDFYVDSQTYTSGTVTLISLDKLYEYDTEYLGARGYVYSRDIVSYLATKHNMLVLDATNIPNIGYAIPLDMNLTDRQVLSYTAQLICKYVTINDDGYLKLSWYDTNILKNLNDRIDSRTFDNIPDGIISGGTFTNIPTNIVNGGTFADIKNYFRADVLFDPSKVDVDDIVITGVRVVTDSENYAEYGAEGYMLNIKSNPFTDGIEQSVATYIGQIVCGMRFRALDIQTLPIPFVECGDIALVSFRGNAYSTVFTNIVYRNDGHSEYICGAESPGKNSSVRNSEAVTEAVIKSTQNTKKQLSAYDIQMQMLTNLMCNGFGTFKTEEKQSDGSVIYYLHNKPNMSESDIIWKMTSDAFAVSTDGGQTWNAGFDAQGNAVVNVLSAIGINFDWAHGGTLKLGGANNVNGILECLSNSGLISSKIDYNGIYSEGSVNGEKFYGAGIMSYMPGTMGGGNAIALWAGRNLDNRADSAFWVNWDGKLHSSDIEAAGGKIGNWIISGDKTNPGCLLAGDKNGAYTYLNTNAVLMSDGEGGASSMIGGVLTNQEVKTQTVEANTLNGNYVMDGTTITAYYDAGQGSQAVELTGEDILALKMLIS